MDTLAQQYSEVFFTDGLRPKTAANRYQKRRNAFKAKLHYPTVISGVDSGPGNGNLWSHVHSFYFQEPLFLYLTGINQTGVALVLYPNGDEALFLPTHDPKHVFWEGHQLSVGDAEHTAIIQELTGIKTVLPMRSLFPYLLAMTRNKKPLTLGALWHTRPSGKKNSATEGSRYSDSNGRFISRLKRYFSRHGTGLSLENVAELAWGLRLNLDATDRNNVLAANRVTNGAFRAVLACAKTAKNERELTGTLLGEIYKNSEWGPSFPPIIASGTNATILHYTKNNAELCKEGLLLMDFGVRWHSVVSDVSRTIPLSGRFNPLQRLLYKIVLDTQAYVESLVKPKNTIDSINTECWAFMARLLTERFSNKGGSMVRDYQTAPHFVSHLMGIQVHDGDPHREYRHTPLQVGQLLSNEPGLYGQFEMTIAGVHYCETIGIRIEDDLLVTAKGCQNLSAEIPKEIHDIESLMA
ncbi:MAG: aminopeptidase P N-terminal domain-containing protein [bacterium]|nr:aminopeptidase P N-terminal domain-containing protein [bacterium]